MSTDQHTTRWTGRAISAFLLARIWEDEQKARGYHRLLCMATACDAYGCIWDEDDDEARSRERVCTCDYPARVLAECAAKRQIVALAASVARIEGYAIDGGYEEAGQAASVPLLRALASVYADHQDFRPEWL